MHMPAFFNRRGDAADVLSVFAGGVAGGRRSQRAILCPMGAPSRATSRNSELSATTAQRMSVPAARFSSTTTPTLSSG